jgi:Ca-activated chloride channel homolog
MLEIHYSLTQPLLVQDSAANLEVLVTFRPPQTTLQPEPTRRPLNLSLVIDRSGSIAGYPLQQAIQAAITLVQQLSAQDYLSVVVYDDVVDTILEPQPVSDPENICNLLRNIRAGGTTNLSGGWLKGCSHVQMNLNSERINRVLLLTD